MATTSTDQPAGNARLRTDPAHQAFVLLRTTFIVAPLVFGADKFANLLTDWTTYLAPGISGLLPVTPQEVMYAVGLVEIAAGLLVAVRPRVGAAVVAAWLAGIVVNLLLLQGFYDVALRDVGLLVAAVALQRLSTRYDSAHAMWRRKAVS
jgi:hypothetical protein